MTLKSLTILGLSSIFLACGGSETPEFDPKFNANNPSAVFDTISATGILVDDISFVHGNRFAKQIMRESIPFIDPSELGAVFIEFENGTKTAIKPEDASKKLEELQKATQNFQQISPSQKAEATYAFVSLIHKELLKKKDLEIKTEKFVEGYNGYIKDSVIPSTKLNSLYDNVVKENFEKPNKNFLKQKEKEKGIVKTASGLLYKVITAGTGAKPNPSNKVKVHYEGSTIDGKIFDSSYARGEPVEFGLGQVIKGWTEGLQLMSPGSKYKLYIPQELGYGGRNQAQIPPYATLIFTVELISFQ